jgi:single-strand DNA-binding protein
MNSVRLEGTLATTVEARVYDERRRASFLLHVGRPERRGADFLPVVAWNAVADACDRLTKGDRVALEGALRSRRWEDAEGRRRRAVEVVATSVRAVSASEEASMAS